MSFSQPVHGQPSQNNPSNNQSSNPSNNPNLPPRAHHDPHSFSPRNQSSNQSINHPANHPNQPFQHSFDGFSDEFVGLASGETLGNRKRKQNQSINQSNTQSNNQLPTQQHLQYMSDPTPYLHVAGGQHQHLPHSRTQPLSMANQSHSMGPPMHQIKQQTHPSPLISPTLMDLSLSSSPDASSPLSAQSINQSINQSSGHSSNHNQARLYRGSDMVRSSSAQQASSNHSNPQSNNNPYQMYGSGYQQNQSSYYPNSLINQSISQLMNQSGNQSNNPSIQQNQQNPLANIGADWLNYLEQAQLNQSLTQHSINQSLAQSLSQALNQATNQSMNQPMNQSGNPSIPLHHPTNQQVDETRYANRGRPPLPPHPVNYSFSQPINQNNQASTGHSSLPYHAGPATIQGLSTHALNQPTVQLNQPSPSQSHNQLVSQLIGQPTNQSNNQPTNDQLINNPSDTVSISDLRNSADMLVNALQQADHDTDPPIDWLQSTVIQLHHETQRIAQSNAQSNNQQVNQTNNQSTGQPGSQRFRAGLPASLSLSTNPNQTINQPISGMSSSAQSTPLSPRSASTDTSPRNQSAHLPFGHSFSQLPGTAGLARSASSTLPSSSAPSFISPGPVNQSTIPTISPRRRFSLSTATPLSSASVGSAMSSASLSTNRSQSVTGHAASAKQSAKPPATNPQQLHVPPLLANVPSCLLSINGQFVDANSAFLDLFGFESLEALRTHSIFVVVHPSAYMEIMVTMRRLINGRAKCLAHERTCVDMKERRPMQMWLCMSIVQTTSTTTSPRSEQEAPKGEPKAKERAVGFYCAFATAPDALDLAAHDREREEIRNELESRVLLSSTQSDLQDELARLERMYEHQFAALQLQQQKHGITQQMIENFAKRQRDQSSSVTDQSMLPPPVPSSSTPPTRGRPRGSSGANRSDVPHIYTPGQAMPGVSKTQTMQLAQLHAGNMELKSLQDLHARKLSHFMTLLSAQTPVLASIQRSSSHATPLSTSNQQSNNQSNNQSGQPGNLSASSDRQDSTQVSNPMSDSQSQSLMTSSDSAQHPMSDHVNSSPAPN